MFENMATGVLVSDLVVSVDGLKVMNCAINIFTTYFV